MKRKLSLIVLLLATAFAGQAYGQACQIDLAHYKMIEPGMTSAAVNQIIGCEGTENVERRICWCHLHDA
jgi:hypothetical protein